MYDTFYGLKAKPFSLAPDPALFFESKGHRSARRYLEYRASQGEGLIALSGETGAGKTTLIRALALALETQGVVVAHLVVTGSDPQELLQAVSLAFGVAQPELEPAAGPRPIEQFLLGLRRIGKRALLIVDEAQNCSVEGIVSLYALAALQADAVPLLQVFLVGQPELQTRMQQAWQQCAPTAAVPTYHLGPLEAAETRRYIEHRLAAVGWRGDPAFDPEACALLHQVSGGLPRRINALCNRLLLNGCLNASHRFAAQDVDAAMAELARELGAYAQELGPTPGAGAGDVGTVRSRDPLGPQGLSRLVAQLDALERNSARMLQLARRIAPERLAQARADRIGDDPPSE